MRPTFPALLVLASLATPAHAEPMVMHYLPQMPLRSNGVPDVPMAARTTRWAADAGLTLTWKPVPLKRSLQELRTNRTPFCVLGAFDTTERRQFARYSLPILQSNQQVFLAASRVAPALRALRSAEAAIRDTRFQLLAFDGVAYGETLDRWIAERAVPPQRASAASAQLLPMLARGRVDFVISTAAELTRLRAAGGPDAEQVEVVLLPGMPPPPTRHLACSQQVPPEWLTRFDDAVRARPAP
ncbi:transporter substrate-binding domain-containing protein [Roseateles asaccharophilus]|uniref:Polar amino acid transport system substrate-binding protein n=1 Tax=Roseateles asaccharophilus TaxID=582607 RepID=A0ABU2A1X1_9BURK|nr:transporter substrate-binding domain-containing protein [Roseateles asaccharophilus]MDR7331187.1 polar amino acid transport system substrate-binding protein [Roseateles asaccharophilus]